MGRRRERGGKIRRHQLPMPFLVHVYHCPFSTLALKAVHCAQQVGGQASCRATSLPNCVPCVETCRLVSENIPSRGTALSSASPCLCHRQTHTDSPLFHSSHTSANNRRPPLTTCAAVVLAGLANRPRFRLLHFRWVRPRVLQQLHQLVPARVPVRGLRRAVVCSVGASPPGHSNSRYQPSCLHELAC